MRGCLSQYGIRALQSRGLGATSCALWWPTLAAGASGLGGLYGHVWSCHPVWGLHGCCQLPTLPIRWGRRHRYLLLESREINLLPPQSDQVIFLIQKRVPVTSFEDGVHGPEVTHHLHRAGLSSDGIYQQAVVVPQLQDSGIQMVIVLHAMWYPAYVVCCWGSVLLNCKVAWHTQRCKHIPMGLF